MVSSLAFASSSVPLFIERFAHGNRCSQRLPYHRSPDLQSRTRVYPRAHAGHSHSHTVKTGANALIESVKFDAKGLVSAVAQQVDTNDVLMVAWMNEEAIRATLKEGRAVYFSRSRQKLWRKGEESGNVQHIHEVLLDCDGDCLLLKVDQIGPACHTGRLSCFYRAVQEDKPLLETMEPLRNPEEMYGEKKKK